MVHDAGPSAGRLAGCGSGSRRPMPSSSATRTCRCTSADGDFQIFNPGSPTERRRAPHHSMGVARIEGGSIEFELVALS